ncbi:MAG: family 78 glycoside hydrolase catalytic domain [Lachnospiraceae bacterium]|nr:family 78 glycoside hydrolase catalytic domain [Lachnospiraceae bacterium]
MDSKVLKKRGIALVVLFIMAGCIVSCGRTSDKNDASVIERGTESVTINHLRTCHLDNPIGIDEKVPEFSWRMEGTARGLYQSAYRIVLARSEEQLAKEQYLWDSGKVLSSESVGIAYEGEKLTPKTRYFWQVTVWDGNDEVFTSNETAYFETGLMGEGMPNAGWLSVPEVTGKEEREQETLVYTVNYDMSVINTESSFVFGAAHGRYGDMYLCQIYNDEEHAAFSLRTMHQGRLDAEETLEETDITACRGEDISAFAVELQIEHENLSVTINGTKVADYTIDAVPVAAVGYYKSRGVSYAYLDNLLVQDYTGNILYEDDFEEEETIFSPYYAAVEEGRLKIGSGLLLTAYRYYNGSAPLFYREFALEDKEIDRARIYMTALGSFELICNGQAVSDDYFAPGKLAYNQELAYVTYDVTSLLKRGENNALGVTLLHGWYDRGVGYPEDYNARGDKNALMGMLEIRYRDGSTQTVVTDGEFWCSTDGPVREDDIYQGEFYDATMEQNGFGIAGFSHENWIPADTNAVADKYFTLPLKGKENEPIRCVEEMTPLSVSEPEENVYVYDFGQNFAGTVRIRVTGERGQTITLRYGEALNTETMRNKDDAVGCVWTENLLTAEATDYYVLKGAPEGESYEPMFTYHGFRYLQITGLSEPIPIENVAGIVLSSDLEQTGDFECSNELLNQYYRNTVWSQRSNFMDNPTDCAQRDERHGWAGDAQVFSLTASYHMNTYQFYRKYLNELGLLQTPEGAFTDIAPAIMGGLGNNCWGDAAVVLTWNLYTQYGGRSILEENYEALCKWMDYLVDTSDDYIRNHGGYGDHLSSEDTPAELSDTAWCAHSAELISKMALILGKTEDAAYYGQVYENYKTAWQNAFVTEGGITVCDTQTSYALGLAFGLFPEDMEESAADRLNTLAEYSAYHINTGYSGIGYLLPALSEAGMSQTAYGLLLREDYPSLLHLADRGATTIYESLNVYRENDDGTYSIYGSMNHYAFGAPAGWLYTGVLGIKSDENAPGYHHILLEPEVSDALTYAKGSYESIYGDIKVEWKQTEQGYAFDIEIPANTTATLELPVPGDGKEYYESDTPVEKANGVQYLGEDSEKGKVKIEIASGSYYFRVE